MGANCSKTPDAAAVIPDDIGITAELSSYEAAVQMDPELQSLDSALHQRTSRAISTLAVGVEVHSLSFGSLKEVTGALLDMNQEVVKVILECKKDIWSNAELFELVEDYFECSLQTLDFCTALEKCLKRARDSQLIIQVALQRFTEEDAEHGSGDGTVKYEKTIEDVKLFKATGDPFDEEFFQIFQSVYRQQLLMLEKLQSRKKKLDKKMKTVNAWRKVSSVIFVATFAAVLICSVVAAVIGTPTVAAAFAAAAAIPVGSVGKWIDSLFKKYLDVVKGHKDILSSMQVGTFIAIKDMDNIRFLVDNLEIQINLLLANADFALNNEEALKIVIEEIKRKLDVFMKSVDDLSEQADQCSRDIRRARTVVLQRIIKLPN